MTTLAEAERETASILMEVFGGTATSGGLTTFTDSNNASRADYFNGGTLWMLSGSCSGSSSVVSDFGSGVFTFTSMGSLIAAGDRYLAAPGIYNRDTLISAINQALADIDAVPTIDDTLTVTADQEEYTLPAGVSNVRRVEVSNEVTDPYDFEVHRFWKEVNGKLYFHPDHAPDTDSMIIRLHYGAPHALVKADADTINPAIHRLRLAWTAAYYAALGRLRAGASDEQGLRDLVNLAQAQYTRMAALHPVRLPAYDTKMASY